MRLKSLEVVGFKSFLEPTTISFAPGVTAVVGPNGCGKSNVVDAIRWVLGEQAPSRLRGKSAEDLIYAGNESNAAAGMAEVSLVLEAEEGSTLPEPYAMLSEVAVTRRVYRSGDSEYLINKIPCRLKDITEFFMAAQVHSRGYAIIEQGRVEEIIQAKPHEIRGMIEEAAGLSLFKGRREISERKLERVKKNLARLDDVLGEIERQLNYARRQAKKAEAYRVLTTELTELERFQAARRIFDQRLELTTESEREAELRSRCETGRESLGGLQAAVETAAAAAQSAESELSAARREVHALAARAAEHARSRDFLARRLEAIDQSEPGHVARLAELEARATLARAARAAAGAALAREINEGDAAAEAELARLRESHSAAQFDLKRAERGGEDVKDELSEIVREAAVIRGRLGDLSGERAEIEERINRAESEAPELTERLVRAREAAEAAEQALSSARAELEAAEGRHREATEREIEARSALEKVSARRTALAEAIESARIRAEQLAASRRADSRLRTVLESLNGDRPPVDPEVLANVLRAPCGLEPALKAVLGDDLDAVIVDSPHFALRAIDILKEKRGGRLSFVPEPDGAVAASHEPIEAPGIAGRLLDMIEVEPRFRHVAEVMLGHVVVADDVRSALAASNLNGHGTLFVTREGDLVWPGRMISGGSVDGEPAQTVQPLHQTAEELSRAEAEYVVLKEEFAARSAEREATSSVRAEARKHAQETERGAIAARAEAAAAEQKARLSGGGLDNARRRLEEIRELCLTSNARLEELAILEQELRSRIAAIREDIVARRAAVEELGAAMLAATSTVEARRSKLQALEQEMRHASQIAAGLERQIDEGETQLVRARAERAEFEGELEKLAAQDAEDSARKAEIAEAIAALEADSAERGLELEARRAELKRAQADLKAAEDEAVECALRCERAKTLIGELLRNFLEKFAVEFDSVAEDLAAELAMRDGAVDETRIAELRAKVERIGAVNLAAEGEVQELEERAAKLGAERQDLDAAVNDLTQTITKLNREARKRFAETFEGAAKNFEEMFPNLLPGGKARLELEQGSDVLEAGVNIMVQPAGKKVKEIALLSGGEKAMSAMALIFSLFLLNPSPFCVMDEVDAPLDEFRLNAFTDLVQELKSRSQFIVITHNQRTMQKADHIHGVTMDRPGVSRVISLKIPQAA